MEKIFVSINLLVLVKTFFKSYSPGGDFAAPQHRKDGVLGMHYKESQFPVLTDCCEEELLW